jgi:glutathione peroxidase
VKNPSVYDFKIKDAVGVDHALSDYRNKVLLIVNVASRCGFTPQYTGLEDLQKTYANRGFSVLGFPCNQFGKQEPGTDAEIQQFCQMNFGVTFPVFGKVEVNGDEAHPLFDFLKSEAPGLLFSKAIKWNFTKFLVDRNGKVLDRFAPATPPEK